MSPGCVTVAAARGAKFSTKAITARYMFRHKACVTAAATSHAKF